MSNVDSFTTRHVFCLIVWCLLLPSEGNEIVLQENAEDVSITPATFQKDVPSVIVKAPNNYRVLVKFLKVQLNGDQLDFYNRIGEDLSSTSLLRLSLRLIPPPPHLISPGQQLLITFSQKTSKGVFILNATLVEENAYAIKLGPGETRNITSPSYPDKYPRLAFSFYTIEAPTGCRLNYRVLDKDLAFGDKLCVSERKIAVNNERCDITEIGTMKTFSRNFASLWFSSDSSFTGRGFSVSFTSIGRSDGTPCIQTSQGLSPAPGDHTSNTASKPTRKKRADPNSGSGNPEATPQKNLTETNDTGGYSLLQLGGVLLAVMVIGVFLNQLLRHLMDLCCQTQPVTMTTTSTQRRSRSRTKSRCCPYWRLTERESRRKIGNPSDDLSVPSGKMDKSLGNTDINETDYITMATIQTSSRVPPRRNPSDVSETSLRDIKTQGTERETIAGTNIPSSNTAPVKQKGVSEATVDCDDSNQRSRNLVSQRLGNTKPVPTLHRKSQNSLLEGDTYITGGFVSPDSPGLSTPDQADLYKQPPVPQVRLREQSSKVGLNKRASISMFDLTDRDLADLVFFDTQLSSDYPRDGQNTSNELEQQSYNPRAEASLIRCKENDGRIAHSGMMLAPGECSNGDISVFTPNMPHYRSLSSSTDSLPMTCVDEGVQWYSPIEQENELARKEDQYSTAMAKFDSLCNSLQSEADEINPNLVAYANLPPVNRKRFATLRRPDRSKPIYFKPPKVTRSHSASAHDLTASSSNPGIDDTTKGHTDDHSGLRNTTSKTSSKSNLLTSFLRNPVSMERSVTKSGDNQTKDRVVSAYRSYCEIDDIEPGCGVECSGGLSDPQGYNLTNIRLDNK